MSTIRVNAIQDTAGVERYTARAWVNFNGTGTVAIRAAGNVSSITDNGTGDYTVNFTTAMADANYSVTGLCRRTGANDICMQISNSAALASDAARVTTKASTANTNIDTETVAVAIFR